MIAVVMWDAVIAPVFYLLVLPLIALFVSPWALLGYAIDLPAIAVPVLLSAKRRGETLKALAFLPSYSVLRLFNAAIMLKTLFLEFILRRSLDVYEKGH